MHLSTHVLDIARGVPAAELEISLYRIDGEVRARVAVAHTDADGRVAAPFGGELPVGTYEIVFHAGAYFAHHDVTSFYTDIPVRFRIADPAARYHIPLLLSPWGYSTYRGS
jgi:5-hydroxyisourate hydrolase